ncbi:MAG: hypothetical protein KDA84_07510, partial [Planctomycetaceae bacterium]|nr:hypothetical protein [Planctomycetaceae bacterium]
MVLTNWLNDLFQSRSTHRRSARRNAYRPYRQHTPQLVGQSELLEDRTLLSTFYVDDNFAGTTPGTDPDGAGPATNFGVDSFATIQGAVDVTLDGDTVQVNDGAYIENVTITTNISLLSVNGRATTTIIGISNDTPLSLGAVVVTGGTNGVQIGDTGQGFTILGIDNGFPGIENAALYFQGGHSNAVIRD